MCYDDQARPPAPEGATGPAHGEDIVLTAADGSQFAAYFATPDQLTSKAQVIIYPDIRGLHQFYKELALRFAEIGIPALAIDYFGRTAGLTSRDDTFDFWPHVGQLVQNLDGFEQDVQAGVNYLGEKGKGGEAVFVVGFCIGGSLTLLSGTNRSFGFGGLVPFYAGLSREFGNYGTPLAFADQVAYPVLGLFGGADQGIPEEQVRELETKLKAAGVENDITIYPGATHSFFDRRATEFADASADAWQKIQGFVAAHTPA